MYPDRPPISECQRVLRQKHWRENHADLVVAADTLKKKLRQTPGLGWHGAEYNDSRFHTDKDISINYLAKR